MKNIELNIQNIRCGGCANNISQKLKTLQGVEAVHVKIDQEIVAIQGNQSLNLQLIKETLFNLVYPLKTEKNSLLTQAKSVKSCAIGKLK